jgi:hypothetical protein
MGMKLVSLDAVYATEEDGVYDCDITMVDESEEPQAGQFTSRPEDKYGLGPEVRAEVEARLKTGAVSARPVGEDNDA